MKKLSGQYITCVISFILCVLSLTITACSDSPDEPLPEPEPEPELPETPETPEVSITITVQNEVSVARRESAEIDVTLSGNIETMPRWTCSSSNESVAKAESTGDSSMKITGTGAGETDVTVTCNAGEKEFKSTVHVTVTPGTYRILAIGNSFSQDAVEQYLADIANDKGIDVIIGNMYIGGCDLDKHWANYQSDAAAYEYRKVENGKKVNHTATKLSTALADEPWDYISLQQASGKSGQYNTYTALPQLISSISATTPEATLIWHQTWAYASSSNHESFPNYGSDQMTMYEAITASARKAMNDNPSLKLLIPAGTAIQNARTTYVGDIFNRDGYHLETTYGRYTAACTWFEAIFGIDATTIAWAPSTVTDEMAAIAHLAAHRAVGNPDNVTVLTEYAAPEVSGTGLSVPVYIDFGPNSVSSAPWNNFTSYQPTASRTWLKDVDGNFVNVNLSVTGGFTGNYLGVSGEDTQGAFTVAGVEIPVTAWKDGLIVAGTKGQGNVGPATLQVSNLDPSKQYDFTIIAVRYNGSRDARITSYRLKGKNESDTRQIKPGMKSADYKAGEFDNYAVTFSGTEPDANGTVTIEVSGIDTGSAAEGHINALVISPAK